MKYIPAKIKLKEKSTVILKINSAVLIMCDHIFMRHGFGNHRRICSNTLKLVNSCFSNHITVRSKGRLVSFDSNMLIKNNMETVVYI